jgi:Domain of unknown function (DUF4189)
VANLLRSDYKENYRNEEIPVARLPVMKKLPVVAAFILLAQLITVDAAPAGQKWGAIAGGLDLKKGDAYTVVIRDLNSKKEAERVAMKECRRLLASGCKLAGAFKKCGWGTTGTNPETGKIGLGLGTTAEEALKNCEAEGLTCKPPSGGCNGD